jgi:two-component system, OmpR family, sensor kinase
MITRFRRAYRGLGLGTRLAVGIGVLALVVFAVVGAILIYRMEHYLERQLDDELRGAQLDLTSDVKEHGGLTRGTYGWYTAVYDVSDGVARPRVGEGLPELADAALAVEGEPDIYRTVYLKGEGSYRVRACTVESGVVLVSAAPMDEIENTVGELVTVEVIAFAISLLALMVGGRAVLRRGLKPLSDMAHTAQDITSHDLTDSARLPVRVRDGTGGAEVEELRTAFNTMLTHIDDSLAARTGAEQRLRRFIADASHELRTPLTSIRGYADLFGYAAANAPEERDRHLAQLRAEATRMSVLVDDLLLLARLDGAEAESPLRLADTDLVDLVGQAAAAFRVRHADHPLTVTADPDQVRLRLDPLRVRQVLDNLLTNAAIHTPAGTPVSIMVSVTSGTAEVRVAEVRIAEVRITDAGPGIPETDQARIFDRFYRVDKARSRDRGGSGLGLAVARSLIQAHNGTIDLTSRPGATTFTITLATRS